MTTNKRAVNTEQAAEMLGIPTSGVRRMIREGQLEAIKLGRYYVVPIQEIDRLLADVVEASLARSAAAEDEVAQRRRAS